MKDPFRLNKPDNFSIADSFHAREDFWLDPPYQRQSDVWPLEKRQFLIDSLLNGFDIPKIYLHEFYPSKMVKGHEYKYAVIDGKQRLSTIWSFRNSDFPLLDDFVYIRDESVSLAGLNFSQIRENYPVIADRFNGTTLPVVTIQTKEIELIEEMFSRLNEGVPLNAAEKRNTFGGPAPIAIRNLAKHKFFTKKLPFPNRRYRHLDLAAKFLFFADHNNEPWDSKKNYLDKFVRKCREDDDTARVSAAQDSATDVLDTMAGIFAPKDDLLRSIGMITIYYLLFAKRQDVSRTQLVGFEAEREENRQKAERDINEASYELLEFDRYTQSPNDSVAMKYRLKVLNDFVDHCD